MNEFLFISSNDKFLINFICRTNYPRGVLKGFGRNSKNEPLTNVMEGGKLAMETVCLSLAWALVVFVPQ